MKKLKWYGIVFALFMLFLYIMGTYDIFMMLSHNAAYYADKGYGQIVVEYFTDYPVIGLIFWIGNLACGLLSPILYLFKKKSAGKIAMTSFICDFILIILGVAFRDRHAVFGTNIFCFDLFILFTTLLFAVFLYFQNKKNVIPL